MKFIRGSGARQDFMKRLPVTSHDVKIEDKL